jgi:signal transduction histidine kinase
VVRSLPRNETGMKESPTHPEHQIDDLIAMIAHDLRSPITAIKGFSQLALRQSDISPQVRNCLEVTINEANRLASLIDDLVLLSELDHRPIIHAQRADISAILRAAIRRLTFLDTATELVLDRDAKDVVAWCDPILTERAIALLIGTARKYCAGSELITVHLHRADDQVIVEVLPSSNVVADKLPALRRVVGVVDATATEDLSPSGLGLYICRRLIEMQGGRVWLDQPADARTRFITMLPGRAT